ncbi:PorT family protein [Flagellimonas sp. HMM57]|uniref:porin family protein n=1 Tax=unclassified Flagellimonas TaxID=2644544 RepID=UPI0013D215CD|nr:MULTISPECIES: porin family protein [unclassified Flagellimonas]UII76685.1 PorT family protein [Flagellimonas sp. HMM57]
MKRFFLLSFILVVGLTNVNSQELGLGVKGGFNFSDISGDIIGDTGFVTRYHFGIVAEVPISDKFSFQPELLYSGQGYTLNDDRVDLDYLSVPLLGKYYVAKGLSLEAGPQIGLLLSAEEEDNTDVKDFFGSVDLGLNLGLGYKFENGLNFNVRYIVGLSDINDRDGLDAKIRNGVAQLSIGYFFF